MTVHLVRASLGHDVEALFTGRDPDRPEPAVGASGNLSHRRPHRPGDLARARHEVAEAARVPVEDWHLMHQVHGDRVAEVDGEIRSGTELRGVDALVTVAPMRALVVQVADCVPILLAGRHGIAAVHAGREGVVRGVLGTALRWLVRNGERPGDVRAVLGPAIGGCCYEVPEQLRDRVAERLPAAAATTRWGTPSLDLPGALEAELVGAGVTDVVSLGICTFEDERYFSHRRDPDGGRQVGLVVRRGTV